MAEEINGVEYEAPALTVLGNLSELTMGVGGFIFADGVLGVGSLVLLGGGLHI